ncbi:MAG: holo-ACP synthase [Candidatus Omnitrophota bacterium]|nr:holo-ACP synthase [Candidatus Omnitrophota bacterium]
MIIGTGIDIIEVLRIKKALDMWGEKFLNRVFTKRELSYANKKKFSHENLAARFACKEAVLKAFGDTRVGIRLKNIEILNDSKGKPEVILHKEAKKFADKNNLDNIIVSMSHTNNYAVSNAILWRNG